METVSGQSFRTQFDLFVFDLDGTLVDSVRDIAASVNHALGRLGQAPLALERVRQCVGRGARVLIERVLGEEAGPEDVERGLEAFLEHYKDQCVVDTTLYPGVAEALEGLEDKALAVLTNKPLEHSVKILDSLEIRARFRIVLGGDSLPTKKPEPDGLVSLVEELGYRPARTLLVGDTTTDGLTARAAGVPVALVPYGFEKDTEWEVAPDYRLSTLADLLGPLPAPGTGG
jgi:phosphoglycolate phosphatase